MRTKLEIETEFADTSGLLQARHPFLVGICGEGMRPLAILLAQQGTKVSGSDASGSSPELAELGIAVSHHPPNLPEDVDALVLSDAIDLATSPEVQAARERGIPLYRRSQLLAHLTRSHKVIAVTGTHGKTTTTALVASGLIGAGLDPLVIVGARVPSLGGSLYAGKGEWAVVEACEAYDALRDIDPLVVVLTNLELDHVDFHGDYVGLRQSVLNFVNKVPQGGLLAFCQEDAGASEVAEASSAPKHGYDLGGAVEGLSLPGRHNALNSAGALAAVEFAAGTEALPSAKRAMRKLEGSERRLQEIGTFRGVTIVDDYAHHPTEIRASIEALRAKYPGRRLRIVFQPHLYSRTKDLMKEFGEALSLADWVWLTDIYPAREAPIPGVSSAVLAEYIDCAGPHHSVRYIPQRQLLARAIPPFLSEGDVVVVMGAGSIGELAKTLGPAIEDREALRDGSRPPRLLVLQGGDSSEREVSLLSGQQVGDALTEVGADVRVVDVSEQILARRPWLPEGWFPDMAVLGLHGTHAEDGAIQGFLELHHIPYTGSGLLSSALAMNKDRTKQLLSANGIRVPLGRVLDDEWNAELKLPLVVKPNAEGSTVGVSFVYEEKDLHAAIEKARAYCDEVLVEELVQGIEISTPVLNGKPLIPVEIVPASGRYDFASKYSPGATEEICPARLPDEILEKAQQIALRCHNIMGCQGASRTDMIVVGDEIVVLEVNTLPGMTRTSLLPNSAAAAGIEFKELCRRIVADAFRRIELAVPGWC